MHFTPRPFWLRMVSTATVVLPVLRSPMISSRWPRPMGVMASMALMPVCSGSLTGWRRTMPGAWTSRRRVSSVAMGPLPSSGSPRASTTRPRRASPTLTERIRPVALTSCSSSSPLSSPRITAPMVSSSRLRARPSVPSSNSRISLTAAPGKPVMRAIPSPTSTMRPTCSVPTSGVYESTCRRRAAVISSALMVNSAIGWFPSLWNAVGGLGYEDVLLQFVQPVPRRAVDEEIADLHHHPAQQLRVDGHLQFDRAPGQAAQGLAQAPPLRVVDPVGRLHAGHPPPAGPGGVLHQGVEGGDDVAGPAAADGVGRQTTGGRQHTIPQEVGDHLLAERHGEVPVTERAAQGPIALHRTGEPEQLVLDFLELGRGHGLEHGGGIPGHPVPRPQPAEHRCIVALVGPVPRGRAPFGGDGHLGGEPVERGFHLRGGHHRDRLVDEPRDLRTDLARQEVVEHRPPRRHGHRAVVDGQGQLVVGVDQPGHGTQLGGGVPERARPGQRLLDGGQIALEGRVHRPPPAAPAAAPLVVSARTAAMASSIRSWWSAAWISRPTTRSAAASTISPTRAVTSSTAAWRAMATSASAACMMRSAASWARPSAWVTVRSAVRVAWATISRAWARASSRAALRWASASSASALARSAASSSPRICSWRSVRSLLRYGTTLLPMNPRTRMKAMSTTMKVPFGMRKLLLAAMSMAVILWSSVGSYGETRIGSTRVSGRSSG